MVVALAWQIYVAPASAAIHYTEQPPLPEWYTSMEVAQDLGESFFEMEGLPRDEWTVSIVKTWALMKREADNRVRKLWEAHHRRRNTPGK